jgi:hypothetical protein
VTRRSVARPPAGRVIPTGTVAHARARKTPQAPVGDAILSDGDPAAFHAHQRRSSGQVLPSSFSPPKSSPTIRSSSASTTSQPRPGSSSGTSSIPRRGSARSDHPTEIVPLPESRGALETYFCVVDSRAVRSPLSRRDRLISKFPTDFACTPGRTRTCDQRLRRPLLYPTELRAQTHLQHAKTTTVPRPRKRRAIGSGRRLTEPRCPPVADAQGQTRLTPLSTVVRSRHASRRSKPVRAAASW